MQYFQVSYLIKLLFVFICSFNVSVAGLFQEYELSKTVTFCHLFPSLEVSCVNAVFHCPLWRCALSFLACHACAFYGVTCIRLTAPCFLWRHSAAVVRGVTLEHEVRPKDAKLRLSVNPMGCYSIQALHPETFPRPPIIAWISHSSLLNYEFEAFENVVFGTKMGRYGFVSSEKEWRSIWQISATALSLRRKNEGAFGKYQA